MGSKDAVPGKGLQFSLYDLAPGGKDWSFGFGFEPLDLFEGRLETTLNHKSKPPIRGTLTSGDLIPGSWCSKARFKRTHPGLAGCRNPGQFRPKVGGFWMQRL